MLDLTVECIKNIVDIYRCRFCDKADGSRVRYPCGHTACDDCALEATSCLICLTPPDAHTSTPAFDEPLTLRAKNALALMKAFEDTFDINVYRRHRLSEQLKIEQELFPTPIKASVKYFNKRKSLDLKKKIEKDTSSKNKENFSISGEQISSLNKMATEKNIYVQQWLEKIESKPRKPFDDLDVNRSTTWQSTPVKRKANIILDNFEIQKSPIKKRTHFKTSLSLVNSQSKLNKYLKPVKREESAKWSAKKFKGDFDPPEKQLDKNKNDENGSGNEEIISINDSQSVVVDKDREAWLAVLRAGETEVSEPALKLECSENIRYTLDVENTPAGKQNTYMYNKIPFIKRSSLSESCQFCSDVVTENDQNKTAGQSENVSITIENNSFITTITVLNNKKPVGSNTKQSAYVQTDIQALKGDQYFASKSDVSEACAKESQDLFTAEGFHDNNLVGNITVEKSEPPHPKTIARTPDSDSDDDLNQSSIVQVTADVHRSSDLLDHGVLSELNKKDLGLKAKPKKRGKTPASSNSSEKENYDPNKSKRRKLDKKSTKKQKAKKTMYK